MTFRTVTPDELEAIAFDNPGSKITSHTHNDVEVRELIVGGDVYEARVSQP